MPDTLYPMLLEPQPSRRLWGGTRLQTLLGLDTPEGADPVGEAWLVYAENPIVNGSWRSRTLQEVANELGADLVGDAAAERYGSKVPLLVKLLDAAAPLSIQVHPDDTYARREEAESGHLGKEEAWYVLEADPDAEIVWGFAEEVQAEQVRHAVENASLESLVQSVTVRPGDVIYNPAGTVHAMGAGIFLIEVQQSSDLTYRLYDWGRRDAQGRTRELHVEQALAVADLHAAGDAKAIPRESDGWTELIRTPFFVMEKRELDGTISAQTSPASMETLTFVRGEGDVHTADGAVGVAFDHASVVLPAALGGYVVRGRGELIRCRVPADAS